MLATAAANKAYPNVSIFSSTVTSSYTRPAFDSTLARGGWVGCYTPSFYTDLHLFAIGIDNKSSCAHHKTKT